MSLYGLLGALHTFRLIFGAAMAPSILSGTLAIFETPNGLTLALMMGAAWVMKLAVAEWLIRRARVAAVKVEAMPTQQTSFRVQVPVQPLQPREQ